MERLRQHLADLQTWFLRLTARERVLVAGAAGLALLFVFFVTLFGLSSSASGARRRIDSKLQKLEEARGLATTYAEAEQARREAEQQLAGAGVSLISYLEEKGSQVGLEIPALTPKGDTPVGDGRIIESDVELTLTDVPLDKLVGFLTAVERGPAVVRVRFLRIEPRPKDDVLTAWATIATYRSKAVP